MSRVYQLKIESRNVAAPEPVEIDFAKELNPQQLAAVTSPPGQALVIAGAGSGKTRTLTYRVAWLLNNTVAPDNILLLTFTNKASREMLERVEELVPGRARGIWGGTFHSVCNRILRRDPERVGLTRQFSILDSDDQKSLMQKVIKELGIDKKAEDATGEKFPKAQVILGHLSYAINTKGDLETVIRQRFSGLDETVEGILKVCAAFEEKKRAANSVDFDDMLTLTLKLFEENPGILEEYQHRFQFILVDEYQDTNPIQSDFIDAVAGEHGNVMVVGDDAQSIYSWRGADFANIIGFPDRHEAAQVFKIETNYRSKPAILALANASIAHNERQFPKKLRAWRNDTQQMPVLCPLYNPQEQAVFVSQRMRELHEEHGIPWSEMAVLYRAHFQSMDVQLQLTTDRVPFMITSGLRFFEQAHIKDFSAFLKLAINPRDESAFDRIVQLMPGVGPGSAAKMWALWRNHAPKSGTVPESYSAILQRIKPPARAQKDWEQLGHVMDEFISPDGTLMPPGPVMTSILEGIYADHVRATFDNAESRMQDLEQFMRFASGFTSVEELLSELSLLSGPESAEATQQQNGKAQSQENVVLSSIHQAKGLEWRVVFIIWLTEGQFPNMRAIEDGSPDSLEEERRLFYVALTRARDELYMLYPKTHPKNYTGELFQTPSRFLEELPRRHLEEWRVGR